MSLGPMLSLPGRPMGGVGVAKKVVADFLRTNIRSVNASMREINGLTLPSDKTVANLLPDPDLVFPYEPPALDAANLARSPVSTATALLYVGCTNTPKIDLVDFDPGANPVWDVYYSISIAVWVKAASWEDTVAARDNLTTSVRACLLASAGLADPHVMRIDQNSIREMFPFPETIRGNLHEAPGGVNCTLMIRETLDPAILGVVTAIDLTEDLLPLTQTPKDPVQEVRHPALED